MPLIDPSKVKWDDEPIDPGKVQWDGAESESDMSRLITGHPKPRTMGQELKRQAGLTARYALSGPIEFAGIFTDPIAHLLGIGSARQGAQDIGDRLGLPNPEGSGERVVGDVSKAVTGAGGLLGLARAGTALPGLAGSVSEVAASRPLTQLTSAATGSGSASIAREEGVGPGGQILAGLIGGLAPGAINYGGAGATRYLARGGEAGRQNMERGIADFQAVGAQPSVGQAAGNRRMQGLESLLAGAPTSSGVMVRAAERQADQIGQGLQGRAAALSPAPSAERAGLAVQRGTDKFTQNVQSVRGNLYAEADRLIPQGTNTPIGNTWTALQSLTRPNPGAPATTAAMVSPKVKALFETVGQDLAQAGGRGLPYDAVKEIRSTIGRELSDFSLTTDKPTAAYKALYAALSRDMEAAAQAAGPDALAAAKRANNYFRASQQRLETLERVVDKAGGPERVYQAAIAGTQDGATTLRAVMRSLPGDGQKALTAAVVKRMGLATKGNQNAEGDQFSAQTFLTNWNGLSKEARNALFGPHQQGNAKFVADMDRVARVAQRIKDGSKVFANPSGTANRGVAFTYAGSLAGSLLTGQAGAFALLAGGGMAANVGARMMTNPRFVAWLARSTELPISALPQQAQMLKQIAASEGDADMAAYADSLTQKRK